MDTIDFKPDLSPKQMLEMGIFSGAYFSEYPNAIPDDLPPNWFAHAQISPSGFDQDLNYFSVSAGQSRDVWIEKGWITPEDPLGWFQWYCRYSLGRRIADVVTFQIKRWKAFGARHRPQLIKNCEPGNVFCRPRQRQALLQWVYDPLI